MMFTFVSIITGFHQDEGLHTFIIISTSSYIFRKEVFFALSLKLDFNLTHRMPSRELTNFAVSSCRNPHYIAKYIHRGDHIDIMCYDEVGLVICLADSENIFYRSALIEVSCGAALKIVCQQAFASHLPLFPFRFQPISPLSDPLGLFL